MLTRGRLDIPDRHARARSARASLRVGGLALALVACRAPSPAQPASAAEADARAGVSAFVVYLHDASGSETVVVPFAADPAGLRPQPPVRVPGLWLQDEGDAGRAVVAWHVGDPPARRAESGLDRSAAVARSLWPSRCPLAEARVACDLAGPIATETVFMSGRRVAQTLHGGLGGAACDCFALPVAARDVWEDRSWEDAALGLPDAEQDDDDVSDADGDDACAEVGAQGFSAQVAALVGGTLYELGIASNEGCSGVSLVDAQARAAVLVAGAAQRTEGMSAPVCMSVGEHDELASPLPGPDVEATEPEEAGLADCGEAEFWELRRGHLVHYDVAAQASAPVCACIRQVRALAGACPSAADPCGDPAAFAVDGEFWVGSDERAALQWREGLALAGPGQPPRAVGALGPAERKRLIGVRYHGDAAPLLAALRSAPPASGPADDFPLGLPAARGADAPEILALAPDDRDFADPGPGSGWGNRCFAHFKAKRLDAAQAACERGLIAAQQASDDSVRGAIYYTLGRIAEARRQLDAAVVLYRTSLALRDNDATRARYRELTE